MLSALDGPLDLEKVKINDNCRQMYFCKSGTISLNISLVKHWRSLAQQLDIKWSECKYVVNFVLKQKCSIPVFSLTERTGVHHHKSKRRILWKVDHWHVLTFYDHHFSSPLNNVSKSQKVKCKTTKVETIWRDWVDPSVPLRNILTRRICSPSLSVSCPYHSRAWKTLWHCGPLASSLSHITIWFTPSWWLLDPKSNRRILWMIVGSFATQENGQGSLCDWIHLYGDILFSSVF